MGYWKTKVLPKIKKLLPKGKKNNNAAEAIKAFEESKESLSKELEENDSELRVKIRELYKSSNSNVQILLKEPTEQNVTDHHAEVHALLHGLAKAGCPGGESLSIAVDKFGSALLPRPVTFLLEKVSMYVKDEPFPVASEDSQIASVENGQVHSATLTDEAVSNEIRQEVQDIEAVENLETNHLTEIEADSEKSH